MINNNYMSGLLLPFTPDLVHIGASHFFCCFELIFELTLLNSAWTPPWNLKFDCLNIAPQCLLNIAALICELENSFFVTMLTGSSLKWHFETQWVVNLWAPSHYIQISKGSVWDWASNDNFKNEPEIRKEAWHAPSHMQKTIKRFWFCRFV